jgi:gliding-associated putative ABC transporter substrate-binding component GldG
MAQKQLDKSILTVALLGSLVAFNVVSVFLFGRLDMTRDKQFTLSDASKSVLDGLTEPLTVRAYFTADLPPPYGSNARYVRDLLDEYYNNGGGNFRYEFIDPLAEETDEDKAKKKEIKRDVFGRAVREATNIERELQTLGIPSREVQVNESDKLELRRAYMGIALHYGDKKEVIPVVQETAGLEYDLTTLIRKMVREKTPKVAFISGHGALDPQKDMSRVGQLLGQLYDVTSIDVSTTDIPADVDAIIVAGPATPFNEEEKRRIDTFVMSGKGAAFLLDAVRPDLQTMQVSEMTHGLDDLLEAYGVKMLPGLVLDAECAMINITQQRGFMRIAQPVKYPFMPMPKALDRQHPLTRGLQQVAFPFMSPLNAAFADSDGVRADVLVKSSDDSWVQEAPYNLDPLQRWTPDMMKDPGSKPLVIAVTGALKSYGGEAKAENARVLVSGGAAFLTDQFMSQTNQALALNLVDWLVLDEALLAMRARGLAAAPLDEVSDGTRGSIKYINVLGLPLAFVAFGLVRWRVREKRRREVAL